MEEFLVDCKNNSDLEYVSRNLGQFPPELNTIVNDSNGQQVLEVGVKLFRYLSDLMVHKREAALRTWVAPLLGYPDHDYTDLIGPFFDVFRSQLLWINSIDRLKTPTAEIKVELVLNLFFRWYILAIELMRKTLAFAAYCRNQHVSSPDQYSFDQYVYGSKDPTKILRHLDPRNAEAVTKFFRGSMRHTLAHGNVIPIIPSLVSIREKSIIPCTENDTEESLYQFVETTYPLGPLSAKSDTYRLVRDFQAHADPGYQSVRVFFFLYLDVQSKHTSLLKEPWPKNLQNPTLGAIISALRTDPDGLHYWKS
ncbi:MAG: hypothetical protein HYX66_10265 [Ignavibacteria bacterium]|nr:hypothetical protein [Ignavibacteria bacterium]